MLGRSLWDAGVALDEPGPASRRSASSCAANRCASAPAASSPKAGEERAALLWIERFELAAGPHLLAVVQDVSEQLKLETQLRQSQKMEAIGHLAAGVAHDFNNLLTVVEGHTSLQLAKAQLDTDVAWSLQQVQGAGERAAALTRQLLAFSRKQIMHKRVVSLGAVINNVASMLRRLIPETIDAHLRSRARPAAHLRRRVQSRADHRQSRGQRPRRHADGRRHLRSAPTAPMSPKRPPRASPEARPGAFVRLTVTDTGEGMSKETLARIFEPFFTTKEVGKGTGMGLATVLGIIQQHEGWIEADSELGSGTTFRIYLPVTERAEAVESRAGRRLRNATVRMT